MFDQSLFDNRIATSWLGRSYFYFKELDSTNSYLKNLPDEEIEHGMLTLCDDQTSGRGQYERTWISEPGKNLTFSLALKPRDVNRMHALSIAVALAISEMLSDLTGKTSRIKWANDVYLDGSKVSGLLTETIYSGSNLSRLIIGVGLNVNQLEFNGELSNPAASIKSFTGNDESREDILADLLNRIEYYYRLWMENDLELIRKINNQLIGFGEWIELEVEDKKLDGQFKFLGINEFGKPRVLNKDFEVNTFSHEQIRVLIPAKPS